MFMLTGDIIHDVWDGMVMKVSRCNHVFWMKDGAALASPCPTCAEITAAHNAAIDQVIEELEKLPRNNTVGDDQIFKAEAIAIAKGKKI